VSDFENAVSIAHYLLAIVYCLLALFLFFVIRGLK
jgi:hypothetical protein